MSRKQKIIFAIILALAAFLIFFRLGRLDLLGDDGHYALRAFGYLDYMGSFEQTTPLQWFGERPAWSYLSFHDHPPMYFFIQHIFFKLFGATAAVSRLTSALAAFGSVIVMFLLGRKIRGVDFGLMAASSLVLSNYFIWTGRAGYLESLFVFWLLLAILYLMKALTESSKNFLWSGLFFGLAMLTKYTLLFFLPAVLLYLLWRERRVFGEKKFWLGAAVFVLAVSPLLIYNLSMYFSRGHFDVQWSDFFGQRHEDWNILQSRVGGWQWSGLEVLKNLGGGLTWFYFALAIGGLGLALYRARRDSRLALAALCFVFPVLFFSYIGGAKHWLGVISPFVALLAAVFWEPVLRHRAARWLSVLAAAYFLVVIWNTNHAIFGPQNRLLTSALRVENLGYNQLSEYFSALTSGKTVPYETRQAVQYLWFKDIKPEALGFLRDKRTGSEFNPLIVYEDRLSWFPAYWGLLRFKVYQGVPIMTDKEFARLVQSEGGQEVLAQLKFQRMYYVHDVRQASAHPQDDFDYGIFLEEYQRLNIEPSIIRDNQGREAFFIYESTI